MAWEGFGCRKEGNKKEVVTPPSADKQWSRRGSFSKSCVGMFSKYKESLFKAHKLCYGSIVIVLSPWHSIWSSGTGVFTEAFLDCINWCGALHAVGLGLFQKERERWVSKSVFQRNIGKVVEGIWDQALCGRTGVLSKCPAEQSWTKLWRKTTFQLKWELQRTGDPRPCDIDKHRYRWKAEFGWWLNKGEALHASVRDGWARLPRPLEPTRLYYKPKTLNVELQILFVCDCFILDSFLLKWECFFWTTVCWTFLMFLFY